MKKFDKGKISKTSFSTGKEIKKKKLYDGETIFTVIKLALVVFLIVIGYVGFKKYLNYLEIEKQRKIVEQKRIEKEKAIALTNQIILTYTEKITNMMYRYKSSRTPKYIEGFLSIKEDYITSLLKVKDVYDIDPNIMIAISFRESKIQQYADGGKGDGKGIFQVTPEYWVHQVDEPRLDFALTNKDQLWKVKDNVYSGAFVLNFYYEREKEMMSAIYSYNGGIVDEMHKKGFNYVKAKFGYIHDIMNYKSYLEAYDKGIKR
jgi:hypothetical protein